jgi:hypothetical protein
MNSNNYEIFQMISGIPDVLWRLSLDSLGKYTEFYISSVAETMLNLPKGSIQNSLQRYLSYDIDILKLPANCDKPNLNRSHLMTVVS